MSTLTHSVEAMKEEAPENHSGHSSASASQASTAPPAQHTPGPWRVGTPGPNGCHTVGTKQGLMTAMVAHSINYPDQREQAIADAHLIAAAPELLEALQAVTEVLDMALGIDLLPPGADAPAAKARAAIAKATGEEA